MNVISTDCIPCIFHLYFQRRKSLRVADRKSFQNHFKYFIIMIKQNSKPYSFWLLIFLNYVKCYDNLFIIYYTRYMIVNFLHKNIIKLSFNDNWYEVDKSKLKTFYIWVRFTVSIKLLWEYQILLIHQIVYNTASSLHALS